MSAAGVQVDMDKVIVLEEWPTPGSVKEVRQAVGFMSYYHPYYSPLDLHNWQGRCMLMSAYPDFQFPFIVTTDGSSMGLGAVLTTTISAEVE